jgi:hypothetical protein
MATRSEMKEAKRLARQELTKVCKVIAIDAYFQYMERARFSDNEVGCKIYKVIVYAPGSQSTQPRNHVTVKLYIERPSGFKFERAQITGRELSLLTNIIVKNNSNTTRIIGKEPIMVALRRTPTEEDRSWAESAFLEERLTKDFGYQTVTIKMNAVVEFKSTVHNVVSEISKQVDSVIEKAKNYKDFDLNHSKVTYTYGEPEVINTEVSDIRYTSPGAWLFDDDPKKTIDI